MGTVRYVDPAGSNTSPYDTWAKAATNIQDVFDIAEAGDVTYCRGTQTITAQIDVDTKAGTNDGGFIKFIGCNSSGVQDGTRFIIDVNSNNCDGLVITADADLVWLENIEVKNCGGTAQHGFYFASASHGVVMINCCSHNNSGSGFYSAPGYWGYMFRCCSYSNTQYGNYAPGSYSKILFSSFHDNTLDGLISGMGNTTFIGCLIYDNGDMGFENFFASNLFYNCVINGNDGNGIQVIPGANLYAPAIVGCRITNHSGVGDIGLNANSEICLTMANYFEDNTGDNIQNATLHYNVSIDGTTTSSNQEDQADTTEGYTAGDPYDYNLHSEATSRRSAITIPTS